VDGLARGLPDLLVHETGLGATGARLRRLVLARYTWDRAAAGRLALYRELLAAGTGGRRRGPPRRALSGRGARPGR
jgi:hypothetical protein